ncbi:putative NADPH-dependent 1-acyl dihydroxyacetone phosphate reductase [Nemania sp. FL0031]|nr:putative NADPH-dependent 1-acyl dihydroxyacetone phosphate reductase [Nemania sp. FL0031]
MPQTIVLITGATRGLGKALVQRFLALSNHTVIAANRDPSSPGSTSLSELPKGASSELIVIQYDARAEKSPFEVVHQLREKHSITHLDIVVPNAAIATHYPLARDVRRADILEHVEVNVLSVISLFQATRELLRNAPGQPIFAPMGSGAGSLGRQPPVPSSVYGASKSMLFWYGIRINAEEEWLNTFVIDPGWVQTDMGNAAARGWGLKEATLALDETMDSVFQLLRTTIKEKHGGKAVLYTGEVLEW